MGRTVLLHLVVLTLVYQTWAHLCLLLPSQRGDLDVTTAGSRTCFRLEAECGGQPAESPMFTYMGGSQMWIKWQQNYNHYEVGYPGYVDIAMAPINSSSWQTIAYVPDEYFYAQDHRKNYTAIVVLPNIECEHCVIRARYQPHKPGESTFYQCSDITIKRSNVQPQHTEINILPPPQERDPQYQAVVKKFDILRRKHGKPHQIDQHCLIGFSYDRLNPFDAFLTSVNLLTGESSIMEEFYININDQRKLKRNGNRVMTDNGDFVYDAISAINSNGNLIQLYHEGDTADLVNDFVMEVDLKHPGDIIKRATIVNGLGYPISSIMPYAEDSYYTLTLADRLVKGQFNFVLGQLTYTATQQFSYKPVLWSQPPETLYVNYQWAEYDSVRQKVYVLMGNENSADKLQARIYTYDLLKRNVTWVELNVDEFTFMSMQIHQKSGRLFAVSPGLTYHFNPYWSLIEIDPATGKSKIVSSIADVGYFALYYGGTIFNGIDEKTDTLYHVFSLIDTSADVIVGINLSTFKMTFSELTNLKHLHNLSYIRANNTCYN